MNAINIQLSEGQLKLLKDLDNGEYVYSASTSAIDVSMLIEHNLIVKVANDYRKAGYNLSRIYNVTSLGKQILGTYEAGDN